MIFAADLINFEALVPLAVFVMFGALAWWVLEWIAGAKPRAVERLDQLSNPGKRRPQEDIVLKRSDTVTKVLEKASPAMAKPLQPKNEMELGKLKTKLANAGFRSEGAGSVFLGLKCVGLVAGLLIGGATVISIKGVQQDWSSTSRAALRVCAG